MDKNKLSLLPTASGIYMFKDANNEVIYIGKAKILRTRVRSYFNGKQADWKIEGLAQEAADVVVIQTKNEAEALLLEAQLVKQYQPKYNVLLKSGQPFIYLLFTEEILPQLKLVRNKKEKGTYIGPFMHKTDARRVHAYLIKTFRLKTCNKKIPGGCLDYHLELCPGTCTGNFNTHDYAFRINLALQALKGNQKEFLKALKERIAAHSTAREFEKARNLTSYVHNFEVIFNTLRTHFSEKKYEHETMLVTAPTKYIAPTSDTLSLQLQEFFKLEKPVHTIDCFDISHFQSNSIVGSCIRFTNGKPEKNKFRRFRIRTLTEQNDYAALQEIVRRRYRHGDYPDLILIDGGKGQLSAVCDLVDAPVISLAKREERVFGEAFPDGVVLDIKTEIGTLLIALRDYAHHFAITYHRLLRAKRSLDTPLRGTSADAKAMADRRDGRKKKSPARPE